MTWLRNTTRPKPNGTVPVTTRGWTGGLPASGLVWSARIPFFGRRGPALAGAARRHRLVATVEDNGLVGGFGDAVARLLRDHDVDVPVKTYGLPQEFLPHGTREEVLEDAGLTSQQVALRITEAVARRSSAEAQEGAPEPRTVE